MVVVTTLNHQLLSLNNQRSPKSPINVSSYEGDYGTIVGFGTTTVGSETRIIFDLFIDQGSFLRDTNIVGSAVPVSGISTGDFFTVYNSNIGDGSFTTRK